MPGKKPEKRADPNEKGTKLSKKTYTKKEFVEFYGKKNGAKFWDQAAPKGKAKGTKVTKEKIELGYWDIRGLAAPLRMMLAYKNVDYNDRQYSLKLKEGGGFDASEWFGGPKEELIKTNPLINLPYVKIGSKLVTQSNPCLQFISQNIGIENNMANEQIMAQVFDLRNDLMKLVYPPPFGADISEAGQSKEKLQSHLEKRVKGHYGKFEAWLAKKEGAKFFAGRKPLAGDFHVFEMLDQHEKMVKQHELPSPMEGCPKLRAFYDNFKGMKQLAKYFEGDKYALPMNNKMAWFK